MFDQMQRSFFGGPLLGPWMGRRRGERREETAGEGEQYRSYTSFYRQLPVPPDVDVDRAQASFKHGLLRLRFPKTRGAANVKRIPITAESREQPEKGRERAA